MTKLGGIFMRRVIAGLIVSVFMVGPLSSIASAGVYCNVLNKLGYENVRECEDI